MPITPEQEQEFIKQNQIYSAPQNAFLAQVSQMPQDQAVKILRLSMQAGLDPVEAARNPTAAIQNLIGATDFEDVGKFAPKTYSFLNDPLHMAIARDKRNVMTLVDMENENKVWTSFKNGVKDLGRNTVGFLQGIADNLAKGSEANRDNMPPEYKMWSEQGGTKVLQNTAASLAQAANSDVLKPKEVKADTAVGQYGLDFVRTAPQIAAQVAAAILTGGTGSMLFMGTQIAGGEYLKLREEGVASDRAFQASVLDAAAQAPLERIGLNKIMKKLPAGTPRKIKAREVVEAGLTEGLTEWIQQYPEAAIEIWARHPEYTPEQRGAQFMKDFAEITKEGAYQGLVAAPFGFLGGAVKVSMQKKVTETFVNQLEKQQMILANSPILQTSPELVEKHLEEVSGGDKTYIDPEAVLTLYQSGMLSQEEIDALLGTTATEVAEAASTGQMVEVSTAKYTVATAQHPKIHQALKEDIAPDEDGMTLRRLTERNTRDIKQAQDEVKKQRAEVKAESDKILEQMKSAGVREDVAKSALVALVKNAYVMSDNPAQWLRDKGPIFQRGANSPEGALHQFAGPSAKTADHLGLSQAKQLEKDGADNEAIRKATGWHKGMEGKWRFEIDDSQAELIDQGQLQATSKEIETLYKQANKAKDQAVKEELLAKADELAANYDEATKPRLKNVLNHPALYQAYPWIANAKVIQSKLSAGENGGYDPATNTIQVSKDLAPDKLRETLLHEIQHAIQEQEDFARGGSPEGNSSEAFDKYQRLAGEVEARDTASRANLTDGQRKETAPDLRSDAIVVHGGKEFAYNPEKGYNIGNNIGSDYETEGSSHGTILRETGEYEGSVVVRGAEGNAYGPDARSSAVRTPGNRSGKTIGLAVTPELVEHGVISLVGRTVKSPKELATISHVLRHPGYEKFHIVYVSGDKVVHHETISAGLPDRASIMEVGQTQGQFFQRVHNNLSSFGADGYYLIHNHPSGDPRPSGADVSLTKYIANITTAGGNANNPINRSFKGHIVLDHTTYSYIGRDGGHFESDIDTSQIPADSYDATSMRHWSLDTAITSPTAVAGLAAGMNLDPNNSVVFYLTTKHKVRGVQIVPNALLADEKKAVRYLRMQARKHYSARFIIVTDNDQTYNTSRELVKNYEHVLDVYHVSAQRYGMKEVSKNANSDEWMGILDKGGGTRLLEEIDLLYQNNDDKRGSIHWNEEGRAIITLFQNADPSTVIHEMVGHYFVQNLIDQGARDDAPAWMKTDRKTALAYAGIEDWETATKDQRIQAHEKLARAAEVYMMEGKAPSIETRSMLRRFKEWLTKVYDTVAGLGVELNPDIRGVFDRMLATEEEIAQVEVLENYHQRLPKEILDTLTESQKNQLDKAIIDAREKAENTLRSRLMAFISADNKFEMERVRESLTAQFTEEVSKEPLYVAADLIAQDYKREAKAVAKSYKDGKLVKGEDYSKEAHFEYIADFYGFSSGDELATKLLDSLPKDKEIQARVDAQMSMFKDLMKDPELMRQEAQEAMYNDEGLTLLAIEDQLIKEKLGQILNAEQMRQAAAFRREEAKRSAEKAMANLSIEKAIKLHTYIAAERRAAEKVAKALAKGDMETAQEQKAVQMFNHAMVMKSLEIRRQFEKTTKYLKRQQKSDKTTWKKEEHFVQAAEILRRFGFLRKDYEPAMREETLPEWANRMNETMDSVAIADWILLEKFESDPKKLTLEQLRDVENAVRNIKRLAQTENSFLKLFNQADIGSTIAEAESKLANRKDVYVPEPEETKGRTLSQYFRGAEKITTFLARLDNWHDFGWFHSLIYRPVYEQANKLSDMLNEIKQKEQQSLESLYPTEADRKALDKKVYYPELGASVSKRYLLEMASHTGSESNRHVLFGKAPVGLEKSKLWVRDNPAVTEANVMEFLQKNLTGNDWRWVQNSWDNINSLWPLAQKVHKKMTGFPMEKVEALPFEVTTVDGQIITMQGGYYPLKEDRRASNRAEKREAESQPLYTETFALYVPKTFTGYTNSRTGATYAIDLRQSNQYRHIQAVAHDIAFREVITDLRRLVNNTGFKELMEAKTGPEGYALIREFIAAAATPKTEAASIGQQFIDKTANFLRERAIVAALMFNVKTAVQNLANPFLFGNAVDEFTYADSLHAFFNRGIFGYWTGGAQFKETRDFVFSKSAFMRDKVETPDFILNEFHGDKQNMWVNWGAKLLAETDNLTVIPMWLEAYHKKLSQGESDADAVLYADTLVDRTTGSSRKIDTASFLRGNSVTRLITMFGTFMNTQYNAWAREFGIALRDKDAKRLMTFAASHWLLFSVASMLLAGQWPDEENDKWVKKWASEILTYPVRLLPLVGNAAATALNYSIGAPTFGFRLSPIESQIDAVTSPFRTLPGLIEGKRTGADMAESIMSAAAFAVPYPDQFNHWFWNAYDILFNDMEPEAGDLMKRRPRKER